MNKPNTKVAVYLRVARDESPLRQEQATQRKQIKRLAEKFAAPVSEFVEHDTPQQWKGM